MTSIRKSVSHLGGELQLFGSQLTTEVQELRRNVEVRPVTGATLYRHCLEDLSDRICAVGEDLAALEAVSLDAISLEELVGHCAALYRQNHDAIAALEARLQSYGYRDVYSPVPPENPLDLLLLGSAAPGPQPPRATDDRGGNHFCSPARQPAAYVDQYARSTAPGTALRPRTAAEAMAPMTAAKARARHDTPSSQSSASPAALSPSMRELMGKYASSSSGVSGLSDLLSRSARKGAAPRPRPSASPAPLLSPAFRAAAEHQREQLQAATGAGTLEASGAPPADSLPATAGTLTANQALLDSYRERYPHMVASTERLQATADRPSAAPPAGFQYYGGMGTLEYEEESTMELKAQVIYNRAAAQQQGRQGAYSAAALTPAPPSARAPLPTPSTQTLLHQALGGSGAAAAEPASLPARSAAAEAPVSSAAAAAVARSRESLQEAIAAALSRGGTGAAPTPGRPVATPAAAPSAAPSASAGTAASTQRARPAPALTPSLPATVPPLTPVTAEDYSSLPAFIRGQLSLEALNAAATAVHSATAKRCAAGGGAAFSMDDVEGSGEMAPSKGKVFVNALAKLGRAQLKVVYGQGTMYFFA